MRIGMLWYDDSNIDVVEKVNRAASYYRQKFHKEPNVCYVHPSEVKVDLKEIATDAAGGKYSPTDLKVDSVEIRASTTILRSHLWIGINAS